MRPQRRSAVTTASLRAGRHSSHRGGRPAFLMPVISVSDLGFRGDLAWIHREEGHAGTAYWPGTAANCASNASGVTLDPGLDLGHADLRLLDLYREILTPAQLYACRQAAGKTGCAARRHLAGDQVLRSIRFSEAEAVAVMPYLAAPYWAALVRRWPVLDDLDVPEEVQTAFLSLGYNRGPGNPRLGVLDASVRRKAWIAVAAAVGAMQQQHPLAVIRGRRRREAALIRQGIERMRSAEIAAEEAARHEAERRAREEARDALVTVAVPPRPPALLRPEDLGVALSHV